MIPSVATTHPPGFDPDAQTRSEAGPPTRDLFAPANDSGVLGRDNAAPVASWADGIAQASLDVAIDDGLEPVFEVLTEGWSSRFSVP